MKGMEKMRRKLRVAIVGCGRISASYEDAFRKLADRIDVKYAVDLDKEKAHKFAEKFCAKPLTNYKILLGEQLDVVHLCLPHYMHSILAVEFLDAGINVLTEKPIAITLQEADQMIEAAERTGAKLGVVFQTRYTKSAVYLKKLIQEGQLGKLLYAKSLLTWNRTYSYYDSSDWKGTWDKEGGGVLIDQAIHSIDRVRYLIGEDVKSIYGSVANLSHPQIGVEDSAIANIEFVSGVSYTLSAFNSYGENSPITIEIIGEKGKCGFIQDMGWFEIDGNYMEIRNTFEGGSVTPSYWGHSHYIQLEAFYRSVLEGGTVEIDGMEGRKTLEIVKGIYKSSKERRRIQIPFEDEHYRILPV